MKFGSMILTELIGLIVIGNKSVEVMKAVKDRHRWVSIFPKWMTIVRESKNILRKPFHMNIGVKVC